MDYFGRNCVSPELGLHVLVSILLGQWITLEVNIIAKVCKFFMRFNPSGSMDYFGSFHY